MEMTYTYVLKRRIAFWIFFISAIMYLFYSNLGKERELKIRRQIRQLQNRRTPSSMESLKPRNAAGYICKDNPLVEKMGTSCRTLSANLISSLGCERMLKDVAAENNRDISTIPEFYRQLRVSDACPESCKLCSQCSPGCAVWFIGNSMCEPACNVPECQYDGGDCWENDCQVSAWGPWSECNVRCDRTGEGGIITRKRQITRRGTANGKKCPPLVETQQGCNKGVPCPVPCKVSDWGPWSPCSQECGIGQMSRSRQILQYPDNGAFNCPPTTQMKRCVMPECSTECQVGPWKDWGPCSETCGKGVRIRSRNVEVLPNGDNQCPPLTEEESCIGTDCVDLVQKACQLTEWGNWSECSQSCGTEGIRTRKRDYLNSLETIKELLSSYNATCPSVQLEQEMPCNRVECSKLTTTQTNKF